ncbi:MAG: peptidase M28 [Acidobacteria bacterium]|nr:MAG: peptidase M28 [Acidobacteriota bacterium]PYR26889.1 MAG: peptidase M28 [Acidobacteriota bacterium]
MTSRQASAIVSARIALELVPGSPLELSIVPAVKRELVSEVCMPRALALRPLTTLLAVVLLLSFAVLQSADADPGLASITADALKGHIYFLASDEMGGRDSLSHEGRIAAEYIAGFYLRAGLKPAGAGGTYFQNFPMVEAQLDREQTYLRAKIGASTSRDFVMGPDFSLSRQGNVDAEVTAPLVFAGYGIAAPEYNYDDFKGVDVRGKVVIVLTHEPQEHDANSRFKGKYNTVHAFNWWKPEVIRRHGAAGILIVQEKTPDRTRPRTPSGPTNGQIRTDRPAHTLTSPYLDLPFFTISRQVADMLLAESGKTIDGLQDEIDKTGQPHSMPVPGVTIAMRRAIRDRSVVQTRNVVGILEGSDPKLKDEYVLVTGHYDHVGQKAPFIYHGADDNASACAAVMAVAEAFRAAGAAPKRSLMFLIFEAEEDGLLGAFHYVNNPIVPLANTVAVLNSDMIGRDEDDPQWNTHAEENRNQVNVVGTLYNPDIRRIIEAQNRQIGLKLDYKTDSDDPEGWFSRSDHYPFAVKGVPMVMFNTGEHPDYHTANDTWDRINYPKIEKITRLIYLSTKDLANAAARPKFVPEHAARTTSSVPQR